jgi:long-subunit fatty acid transport protein
MNFRRITFILPFLLFVFSQSFLLNAFPIHMLNGIYFENPALLNRVKHWEFTAGDDYADVGLKFKGTSFGQTGKAHSRTYNHFPYGQIAHRLNDQLVVGVTYLQNPEFTNIQFGKDSLVRFATSKTVINSYRAALRASYQLTPDLALGLGLDVQRLYNTQIDFVVPNLGNVVNKVHSKIHLAYEFGIFYNINPTTFLNTGFYITQTHIRAKGKSESESGLESRDRIILTDPFEYYIQLIHVVCDKLTVAGKINYSNWRELKSLDFKNTVIGDFSIPTHWYDVWTFEGVGQYKLDDKWQLIGGLQFVTNFVKTKYNLIGFPGGNLLFGFGGFTYQINECLNAQLIYTHGFYTCSSKINDANNHGRIHANINVLALRLTYAW